jgi:hypothetical protein
MEPSGYRANLGSSVYTRIGTAKFQQSRNYGVADSSTGGEKPTAGRETGGLFPVLSGICRPSGTKPDPSARLHSAEGAQGRRHVGIR